MPSVLRRYHPAECDEHGAPLDWECCRTCGGNKVRPMRLRAVDGLPADEVMVSCETCEGHGSLKAAALAYLLRRTEPIRERDVKAGDTVEVYVCIENDEWDWTVREVVERDGGQATFRDPEDGREYVVPLGQRKMRRRLTEARCEGCGHPMSDGTWERETPTDPALAGRVAAEYLRRGEQPPPIAAVHWSLCDEGCRHADEATDRRGLTDLRWAESREPVGEDVFGDRVLDDDGGGMRDQTAADLVRTGPIEASWRPVDVRAMLWPNDLSPDVLMVLCLRCDVGLRAYTADLARKRLLDQFDGVAARWEAFKKRNGYA